MPTTRDQLEARRGTIIHKISNRVKVDPDTGCHLWTGPTSGTKGRGAGYGRMSLDGQTVAVHLVVFCHYFGMIPSKKQVDHTCRNRLCCNPNHLELVTHLQNQKRRAKACIAAKNTSATRPNARQEALPNILKDAESVGSCGKKPSKKPESLSTGRLTQLPLPEALLPKIREFKAVSTAEEITKSKLTSLDQELEQVARRTVRTTCTNKDARLTFTT